MSHTRIKPRRATLQYKPTANAEHSSQSSTPFEEENHPTQSTDEPDSFEQAFPMNPQSSQTPDPFAQHEEEGQLPESPEPLQYLHLFTEQEIKTMVRRYGKPAEELDELISDYYYSNLARRLNNSFAIFTNISSSILQIVTSRDGIQNLARLFDEHALVSNTLGLAIGTPLALIDLAFNLTVISAAKKAIEETLDYASRDSYQEQFQELIEQAKEEPRQAAETIVKWTFNKTILYTHNLLLGAAANIIAGYEPVQFFLPALGEILIPAWMPLLSVNAQFCIAAAFAYGGNRYYSLFSDPDYYQNFEKFWLQGVKDLWNNKPESSPWLFSRFHHLHLTTRLQIAIQGLSTVTIRTLSFYYLASAASEKLLGFDQDTTASLAAILATLTAWHTLCSRYPQTYNYYLADHLKIEAWLRENRKTKPQTVIASIMRNDIDSLNIVMSPNELNKYKAEFEKNLSEDLKHNIDAFKIRLFQEQVLEAKGAAYALKNDPSLALQLAFRTLIGLYLGYSAFAPLLMHYLIDEPFFMTALSLFLGAGLTAGPLYEAEKIRITNQLVWQKINSEEKEEAAPAIQDTKTSNRIADLITFGSNLSRTFSVLGFSKRVFGEEKPALTSTFAIIAAETMVNTVLFTYQKVRSSVYGWFSKPTLSNTQGTFFYPAADYSPVPQGSYDDNLDPAPKMYGR